MVVTTAKSAPTLVEFLRDPTNYPDRPRQVQLCETHISWVFLTDRFAYKLKKPVQFRFLDYSTLAARRHACLDELRLNRRLAPDVYLEVLPLGRTAQGQWTFAPDGEPLDWIVKMRRLPEEACLAKRLVARSVSERELETLADYLADFYRQQPPLTLRAEAVRHTLVQHIQANEQEMLEYCPGESARVQRIHAALHEYVLDHTEQFDDRVCDGRIVDGHGDLRPEHIYLLKRPAIIDCVEFSADLRTVDILDELSFLVMECEHLGHPAVGERILDRYAARSGDQPCRSLTAFYKMYRAAVRAKVLLIRGSQELPPHREQCLADAIDYLHQAESYRPHMVAPRLVVVTGLMGSGKSTLATAVATSLQCQVLRTDAIRRQLHGERDRTADYGTGLYSQSHRAAVYARLFEDAESYLRTGQSVVLDGTFLTIAQRRAARNLAERCGARLVLARCICPRQVALDRLRHRATAMQDLSDGRSDLYDQQAAAWEDDGLDEELLLVDSCQPNAEQLAQVLAATRRAC